MDSPNHQIGTIALPDDVALMMRPDVGVVIGSDHPDFEFGARVIVTREAGKRIEGFFDGDFEANGEVALIGITGGSMIAKPDLGNTLVAPQLYDANEVLMGFVDGEHITPSRGNLLVRLSEARQTHGGILLTENYREVGVDVLVESVGVGSELSAGDRVIIHEGAIHPIQLGDGLALVPEWAVYVVCK